MMSLKTQDIPGAKPKIRHAPRTLIRDQKISQHMPSQSLYPSYSDPYQYQYPYSLSPAGGNNQPVGKQENQRSYLRKQGENYMGLRSSSELSPKMAGRSSNEINNSIIRMDKSQNQKSPYMLPKEAPKLPNPRPTTYTNSYNSLNNQLYNKYNKSQSHNTPKNEDTPSPIEQIKKQKQIRPSSNVSVSSMGNSKVENGEVESGESGGNGKSRGLFRGLGFNIITNNKFVYDMQNRYLNSTTKWAD